MIAACTALSESEQELDLRVPTEIAESQADPEAEYEQAKQNCADLDGEWRGYMHGDGFSYYTYSMRCWSQDDLPSGTGDPRWSEPGLLPYDLFVVYSTKTNKLTSLTRIDPETKEKLDDDPDLREMKSN